MDHRLNPQELLPSRPLLVQVWKFLQFNVRAWFLNMLNFGVLRIYLWWPGVRVLRSPLVRREVERQLPAGLLVLVLVARANPAMLWFVLLNMLATNLDLNINTWVQHAFAWARTAISWATVGRAEPLRPRGDQHSTENMNSPISQDIPPAHTTHTPFTHETWSKCLGL